MTFPTDEEFANCELSIEELEAIAAGWPSWVRSIGRGIETAVHDAGKVVDVAMKGLVVASVVYGALIIGSAILGGGSKSNSSLN